MDVEFMLTDSLEVCFLCDTAGSGIHMIWQAIRPKLALFKTLEEAAIAVEEMFALAFQTAGRK